MVAAGLVRSAGEAFFGVSLARVEAARGLQRAAAFATYAHAVLKPAPRGGPGVEAALRSGGLRP